MAWKSFSPVYAVEDVREDRKTVRHIEQYGFTGTAVYMQGGYLPYAAVTAVLMKESFYAGAQCCGGGFPVTRIRLSYGDGSRKVLMFEKRSNAEKAVALIREANPRAVMEEDP